MPFNGGFAQFERTLDKALDRDWNHHRNIDALLEYARRIKDREALIVLATDEHAMEERHITTIRRITRTHPMVLIDVATMNPFKAVSSRHAPTDGLSARRVPAFHPCRFPYHSIRIQRIHVRSFRRPGVPGIGPHHTQ